MIFLSPENLKTLALAFRLPHAAVAKRHLARKKYPAHHRLLQRCGIIFHLQSYLPAGQNRFARTPMSARKRSMQILRREKMLRLQTKILNRFAADIFYRQRKLASRIPKVPANE